MTRRLRRVFCVAGLALVASAAFPALAAAQKPCQRGTPLALDEVLKLVAAGVDDQIVANAIASCGTDFILDQPSAKRLRSSAGLSLKLVAALTPPAAPGRGTAWRSPVDGLEMVWLPPGRFLMGSTTDEPGRNDDEFQHEVRIEQGFWMDVSEVTNQAFRRFVLANPQWQKARIDRRLHDGNYLADWHGNEFPEGQGARPVTWVSWPAAVAYAKWAGERLSTEAEWEYAARSGTQTAYWWGGAFDTGRIAGQTAERGNANLVSPWGLVGMLGGVWEWTSTLYRPYPYRYSDGREGPDRGRRTTRGGMWNSGARFLRAANRSSEPPELASDVLGFRCVR